MSGSETLSKAKDIRALRAPAFLIRHVWRKLASPLTVSGFGERMDIDLRRSSAADELGRDERAHLDRYRYAARLVDAGSVVGDFACGTGYGTAILAQVAARAIGVDLSTRAVETASARYGGENVEFRVGNVTTLAAALAGAPPLDAIVSFETLEHLEELDLVAALVEFRRALRDRGTLIFSTPYLQPNAPVQHSFHRTFEIDEAKLTRWLAQAGFRPLGFDYQDYSGSPIGEKPREPLFVVGVGEAV